MALTVPPVRLGCFLDWKRLLTLNMLLKCCGILLSESGTLSQQTPNPDFSSMQGAGVEGNSWGWWGNYNHLVATRADLVVWKGFGDLQILRNSKNWFWGDKTLDIHHTIYKRSFIIPPPCNPTQCFATLNWLICFPWSHLKPFPPAIRAETSLFWNSLS